MLQGLIVSLSVAIGLASNGATAPPQGGFIFIEERPPFTSLDRAVLSEVTYLNDRGLVQRYACEDANITALAESSLNVADCFKKLSAISFKDLSSAPVDENQPPSQAGPPHTRLTLRKASGEEYSWAGTTPLVPAGLLKLLEEARALAARSKPAPQAAREFVRADVLIADRLDEYRVSKLLKTVETLHELDPVLRDALLNPFCLIPVPAGKNPFSAFVIKGESSPLSLLYNGTGSEVSRYSFTPPSRP